MQKSMIREINSSEKSLAKELHDARISAQLTLEQVHDITKIPIHIIDRLELGMKQIDLPQLYMLAKAYNKKIQINLVARS